MSSKIPNRQNSTNEDNFVPPPLIPGAIIEEKNGIRYIKGFKKDAVIKQPIQVKLVKSPNK